MPSTIAALKGSRMASPQTQRGLRLDRSPRSPLLAPVHSHVWHARPENTRRQSRRAQAFNTPHFSHTALNLQHGPAELPYVFADLPNALSLLPKGFQLQPPSLPTVFFFLLQHPFVTLSLAIFLYITIPRLWRAFVKYILVPSAVVGAGIVVVRNPDSFRSAGVFVAHFTSDHPYITSGFILIALTLLLSPYFLTALLAIFIATGAPRLPPQVRNFLPAPFLEVEQSVASFDSVVRGPINSAKERALEFGSGLTAKGSALLDSVQGNSIQAPQSEKAPALTDKL